MLFKTAVLLAAGLLSTGTFALPQASKAEDVPSVSIPTGTAAAAPENQYPSEVAVAPKRKANTCTQTYTDVDATLDFEYLGPLCVYACPLFGRHPLVYAGRGSGWAYYGGTSSPVLFPNLHNWFVMNCTAAEFVGKPEAQACGTSNKAILSPGSSPYDSSLPARFNTIDFPDTYLYFNLKSLYITPLVNGTDEKASVTFTGIKKAGGTVTHTVNPIENNKRSLVTFPSSFSDLIAFDTAVKKIGGGDKFYAFAFDDIKVTEHTRDALPTSCAPPIPTGADGPCKPKPTQTKRVTINFDEIEVKPDVLTEISTSYKGITWPFSGISFVFNKDTINSIYSVTRMQPGDTIPPSGKNFLYSSSQLELAAATQDERFGVSELSILCNFPPYADPDYLGTNGKPCVVTFVGRRDRFDGSGLPELVEASVTFPNPGNDTSARTFKKVNLNGLTNSRGKFDRLVRFSIYAELGDNSYGTGFALDNIKLTKELGEGTKCRVPGVKTMNFDDLPANSFVPTLYKDFKFFESAYQVTPASSYPPGSPGHLAAVSKPNAAKSRTSLYEYFNPEISSNISPVRNTLFHLESVTITLDIAPTNTTALAALSVYVSVYDACGMTGYTLSGREHRNMPFYYSFRMQREKTQIVFTYPYFAISRIQFYANFAYGSGFENDTPGWWIDEFKYRPYDGKIPGCQPCGFRGSGFCENPRIAR